MQPWEAAQFGLLYAPTEKTQYGPVENLVIDWARKSGRRFGGLLEPERYPEEDAELRQQLQDTFLGDMSEGQLPDFGLGAIIRGIHPSDLTNPKFKEAQEWLEDTPKTLPGTLAEYTGYWQSPLDKKWRTNIDDSSAKILEPEFEGLLGDNLVHDELYDLFPEARNIDFKLELDDALSGGFYRGYEKKGIPPQITVAGPRHELLQGTMHEGTHYGQMKGGLLGGANYRDLRGPSAIATKLRDDYIQNNYFLRKKMERAIEDYNAGKGIKSIEEVHDRAAKELYLNTVGEREARAVEQKLLHPKINIVEEGNPNTWGDIYTGAVDTSILR